MFYFIQGVFFEELEYIGLGLDPIEGTISVINKGTYPQLFVGAISHTSGPFLVGSLRDKYGESTLTDICLVGRNQADPEAFSFKKKYKNREDVIDYTFKHKVGNVWIGRWGKSIGGNGIAKCTLTEVTDDNFFDPISTLQTLRAFEKAGT